MGIETIIETNRINLREFALDDNEFIFRLVNAPGWLKNIGSFNITTAADAQKFIAEKLIPSYKQYGFGFWVMGLKPENIPVGMCGLIKRKTLDDVDIGFALLPEYEGNGFATEAAVAVMKYAKETLKLIKLAAVATPHNVRSIKILTGFGFNFEKIICLPGDEKDWGLYSKMLS